jgi:hypothetical protein
VRVRLPVHVRVHLPVRVHVRLPVNVRAWVCGTLKYHCTSDSESV